MQYLGVLIAAFASFAVGAVYYMTLSKQWIAAAELKFDEAGKPIGGKGATPFIIGGITAVLVSGMMRHIMVKAELSTPLEGLMVGFGLGAFVIAPWTAMNYGYAGRKKELTIIDGGYAVLGSTTIGLVLSFFL